MPVLVEDIIPAQEAEAPQQGAEAPQQEAEAPQQKAEAPQQEAAEVAPTPKRRGRSLGSKNKPKPPPAEDVQEDI